MELSLLEESSRFKMEGRSTICGNYTTSATPLVLRYSYGNMASESLSLLYEAASDSGFVDLSATPLVRSDIEGFGTPSVSATKSTIFPFYFLPTVTYQMTFSDGTQSETVNGVQVSGVIEFDASTISGTVNLAHIVRMNLIEKFTGDTAVTFEVIPGKEDELDDVKLRSDVYTNITSIKAFPKQ